MNQSRQREVILDEDSPLSWFRYDADTKILVAWWKKKPRGEQAYAYFNVELRTVQRLREINKSKKWKQKAIKGGATVIPSVGTFFNTKIKKYPTLNLAKTKAEDFLAEGKRISAEVETRSKRAVPESVKPKKRSPVSRGETTTEGDASELLTPAQQRANELAREAAAYKPEKKVEEKKATRVRKPKLKTKAAVLPEGDPAVEDFVKMPLFK